MSEEKNKQFWDPNGLYNWKNRIGVVSVMIGGLIGLFFWLLFILGVFAIYDETAGGERGDAIIIMLIAISSWKMDVGLAILLGSTIISGAILLAGIRKE